MNDSVIQVRDFRKVYGDFVAVDNISFDVRRGEIFGLLGPNGAGKTRGHTFNRSVIPAGFLK